MIVTIVLTAVCLVQQCWPVLVCMVPALIAAVVVSVYIGQVWIYASRTGLITACAYSCHVYTIMHLGTVYIHVRIIHSGLLSLHCSYYH